MLSCQDVPNNPTLMFSFLGFWATSINGFIFPFTTISPTLLDVVAIIGLPIKGEKLPALFSLLVGELGIQFSKLNASYSTFLTINVKSRGLVSNGEHYAFLLYCSINIFYVPILWHCFLVFLLCGCGCHCIW